MPETGGLERRELISAVCRFFCKGYTVRQILLAMAEEYPQVELKREDPYALVRDAARRGWLRFRPPP